MDTQALHELIGYTASALVVLSLLMSSLLRLRTVSLVGASVFTVYGLLIDALPVVLTNGAIVLINIYYLVRMLRDRAADVYYEVVEVGADSPLLRKFVEFHLEDIRRFQPDFAGVRLSHLAWMVLRDGVPVGAVLAAPDETRGEVARLDLDYVAPPHRDFRPGQVLFGESGAFRAHSIRHVETTGETPVHRRYLRKMGFEGSGDTWRRDVP